MTTHYGAGVLPEKMSEDVLSNKEASDVLIPMGCVSLVARLAALSACPRS